ncbi:ribonuclease H-like domain-containing protein [Tanacetum coccineum]
MNQFCEMKGIKREFSIARTPQQNGVAERKNRTLIEAARTMLADSKLPTTFWAEAVNTACRKPALSFMRPFGCPVTILNTIDHLGKFNGKADEGFFVGYSTNSKAFKVFNSRTRIVEENMHVKLEWRQYLAKITYCYQCGMLIHYSLKIQRVLLMLDSNHQGEEKKDVEDPGNKDSEVPKMSILNNDEEVGAEADMNNLATTVLTEALPWRLTKHYFKDEEAADVDVYLYRSMIGSLIYLTTSRPDINVLRYHIRGAKAQIRFEAASKIQSNDPPLSRVNILGSGKDIMKLSDLIDETIERFDEEKFVMMYNDIFKAKEQAELEKERVEHQEASREAIIEELDNIQVMIDANEQLAAKLQAEEQEQFLIQEKSRMLVEMIAKRKKFFAAQRAAKQRSKPPTKNQIK